MPQRVHSPEIVYRPPLLGGAFFEETSPASGESSSRMVSQRGRSRGDRHVERSQGTARVRFCSDRCASASAQQTYRERKRATAAQVRLTHL